MLRVESSNISGASNHPRANLMAVIAFLSFNMTVGCIYGSFSVLLTAVQSRLGVGPALSALGIPAVTLSTALCSPVVGWLATRYSLRLIMLAGSLLLVAGFLLLAFGGAFPLYILAYGVLLGPGVAVGIVLPGTLVTRWFAVNRGKALGFISTPVVVATVPMITSWTLQAHGLQAAYLVLAAMTALTVLGSLFVIDRPPGVAAEAAVAGMPGSAVGGFSMAQLLRSTRFWGLSLAFIASSVSSIVLAVHIVPMAHTWGITPKLAASLLTIMAVIGIVGTNLFGWIADRLGAVLALVLIAFDGGMLWLLLLLHPSYPAAAVIIGLIGLHVAGGVPVFSTVLAEVFGKESFSRAYGLVHFMVMPFAVFFVPAAGLVYSRTDSYAGAIIAVAAFLLVTSLLAMSARRRAVKLAV
jgi:MFS family permease